MNLDQLVGWRLDRLISGGSWIIKLRLLLLRWDRVEIIVWNCQDFIRVGFVWFLIFEGVCVCLIFEGVSLFPEEPLHRLDWASSRVRRGFVEGSDLKKKGIRTFF